MRTPVMRLTARGDLGRCATRGRSSTLVFQDRARRTGR